MKKLKFEDWDGKELKGVWELSFKIDGVQAINRRGKLVTKKGNPIHHLPKLLAVNPKFQIAEVYCGSWGQTMSIVTASKSERREVLPDEIFPIYPQIDPRLRTGFLANPLPAQIKLHLSLALAKGFEGIVLRQGNRFVKVKEKVTVDVKVIGIVASKAKTHKGFLKEFVTKKGKVGVGLTKEQRKEYMDESLIGSTIEVEIIGGYTKNGKFRHARFIRLRPDK